MPSSIENSLCSTNSKFTDPRSLYESQQNSLKIGAEQTSAHPVVIHTSYLLHITQTSKKLTSPITTTISKSFESELHAWTVSSHQTLENLEFPEIPAKKERSTNLLCKIQAKEAG